MPAAKMLIIIATVAAIRCGSVRIIGAIIDKKAIGRARSSGKFCGKIKEYPFYCLGSTLFLDSLGNRVERQGL